MECCSSFYPLEVIREESELLEKFLLEPKIFMILISHGGLDDFVLLFG